MSLQPEATSAVHTWMNKHTPPYDLAVDPQSQPPFDREGTILELGPEGGRRADGSEWRVPPPYQTTCHLGAIAVPAVKTRTL